MSVNKKNKGSGRGFFLWRWLMRLLFPQKELSIYEEEQIQSPMRMVIRNFFSKKLAAISLMVFVLIALFVFIAPGFVALDLGEQDSTLVNISPGYSMMKYPEELKNRGIADLAVGNNYSVACDMDGRVYVWGKSKVTKVIDLKNVPEDIQKAHIVMLAAGADHVLAVDDRGTVYAWGNNRLRQINLPDDLVKNNSTHEFGIKEIHASNQFSVVITDNGRAIIWGNPNFANLSYKADELDGHVSGAAVTNNAYMLLTDTGAVVTGNTNPKDTVTKVPEGAASGVVQISATSNTLAALKDDGSVLVWGSASKGENRIPEFKADVTAIAGGRYHYTALLADGSVVSWGNNRYKQSEAPEDAGDIVQIHVGSFQNYAIDADGGVHTWGLKGFLLGTDGLGRDVFARLVNGGKMTMTIGALSVVISMIIGIILGGVAGYFGGIVDMVIMRIAEVVGSMPFIPFAMILSAVLGQRVTVAQRMYIIMVILGVLSWPGLCRLVRAQMFAQREMEYVVAAKALGVREGRIIFSHIIPNVMSVCLVSITLSFGTSMLTESTLSYLGFGVPLPTPTWGNMLTGANNSIVIQNYWWNWVFVGAIFGITCICINLIGDGLRDALDPKANGR